MPSGRLSRLRQQIAAPLVVQVSRPGTGGMEEEVAAVVINNG